MTQRRRVAPPSFALRPSLSAWVVQPAGHPSPDSRPPSPGGVFGHVFDVGGGQEERFPGPQADVAARAREYHAEGRRLWLLATLLDLLILFAFWASGASAWLAAHVPGARPLQIAAYVVLSGLGYTLLLAPLSVLRGYRLPRRYGVLRQSFGGWLADAAKAGALGGAFGLLALEFVYWTLAVAPAWWWLIAGVAGLLVSLLLGLVAPVLIAPLFFRFTPLARPDVLQRIEGLLARGRLQARGVYEFDLSRKFAAANAAVFGFGPTRRIVLADSLLDRYSPAEIEAVVAHELGHHAHRDLWIGAATGGLVTLAALLVVALLFSPHLLGAAAPLLELGSLPLWLLVFDLALLALNPLALAASRWSERRADAYARATASERPHSAPAWPASAWKAWPTPPLRAGRCCFAIRTRRWGNACGGSRAPSVDRRPNRHVRPGSSGQAFLRHPKRTTYRCSVPGLTGFVGLRRAGPVHQHWTGRQNRQAHGLGREFHPALWWISGSEHHQRPV